MVHKYLLAVQTGTAKLYTDLPCRWVLILAKLNTVEFYLKLNSKSLHTYGGFVMQHYNSVHL